MYKQQINEYVTLVQKRKSSEKEKTITNSITNYIPHHGVTNAQNLEKLRVVFDASAKFKNALNKRILLDNLVSVLLKFRKGIYVLFIKLMYVVKT